MIVNESYIIDYNESYIDELDDKLLVLSIVLSFYKSIKFLHNTVIEPYKLNRFLETHINPGEIEYSISNIYMLKLLYNNLKNIDDNVYIDYDLNDDDRLFMKLISLKNGKKHVILNTKRAIYNYYSFMSYIKIVKPKIILSFIKRCRELNLDLINNDKQFLKYFIKYFKNCGNGGKELFLLWCMLSEDSNG